MYRKLRKIGQRSFVRNVFIIATGTAAAQIITFIFSPIITRIYGPEAFGIWGAFMAIVAIISPLSALTYPQAIVLPKYDRDAKTIIKISLLTSIVLAFLLGIILIFFKDRIVHEFKIEIIANYLFLIPFVVIFSALLEVAQQWLIRTKQFRITARSAFLNALILNSVKTGIGFFNPVASVLIILTALGNALHAMFLIMGAKHANYKRHNQERNKSIKELIKEYKDFPLFRAPQTCVHVITQNMPVLFLGSFFGPSSAGFYSLARSVLGKPIQLLGKSVGDVFYPRITEAAHRNEKLFVLIIKATIALAAMGVIPFGIIIFFGPWIFGLVFGSEWSVAGEYASWLAIGFFFGFINRPSVVAIPVLKLQGQYLIYEVISGIFRLSMLFFGYHFYSDGIYAVIFFALSSVITNLIIIIYTIIKSRDFFESST